MIGVAQIVQSGGRPVIHQNLKEFANLLCKTKADNPACNVFTRGVHTMSLEEAIASGTVPPPHNFMYKR